MCWTVESTWFPLPSLASVLLAGLGLHHAPHPMLSTLGPHWHCAPICHRALAHATAPVWNVLHSPYSTSLASQVLLFLHVTAHFLREVPEILMSEINSSVMYFEDTEYFPLVSTCHSWSFMFSCMVLCVDCFLGYGIVIWGRWYASVHFFPFKVLCLIDVRKKIYIVVTCPFVSISAYSRPKIDKTVNPPFISHMNKEVPWSGSGHRDRNFGSSMQITEIWEIVCSYVSCH